MKTLMHLLFGVAWVMFVTVIVTALTRDSFNATAFVFGLLCMGVALGMTFGRSRTR